MAQYTVQPFQDTTKKQTLFGAGVAATPTLGGILGTQYQAPAITVPQGFNAQGLYAGGGAAMKGLPQYNQVPVVQNNAPVVQNNPVIKQNNPSPTPTGKTVSGVQTSPDGKNTITTYSDGTTSFSGPTSSSTVPTPGSAASLMYQAPTDTGYNYTGQDGNIYNSATGQIVNQPGSQAIDANQTYQDNLKMYQAQIDSLNNIYNDQLNQSRITNAPAYQARSDQNRLQQIQGGIASSPMGTAQTNNVTTANNQEQAAAEAQINAAKASAINAVLGNVTKSSQDELAAKRLAKASSADEYVKYLNGASERKASSVSAAIKELLSNGVNIEDLSPEELKSYVDGLGISEKQFTSEYKSAQATAQAEATKADQESRKTEAEILKLEGNDKQTALDNALKQGQIDVNWYNANTSRMNAENKTTTEKLPTAQELSQTIYKTMADPSWNTPKEGQSNKQLKEAQKQYIMLLGGNPADYGY